MSSRRMKFLGRGWQFPPRFDVELDEAGCAKSQGGVSMVANEADIRDSLRVLMSTVRGERIMRPDYGLGLQEFVFDLTDETSLGHLRSSIEHAVLHFEPRIKIEDIHFDKTNAADGYLLIRLQYRIPAINSRGNMVYPFYFEEGTSVPPSLRAQGSSGS